MAAASVQETQDAINAACRSRGGTYAEYSCKVVSWDDVSRGSVGVDLSCWGSNITDTYLKSKDGQFLFTVRSDNWNEKLGCISAKDIAVLVGNTVEPPQPLMSMSLHTFLRQIGIHGAYAGLKESQQLSDECLDDKVSIRFQTTFLPVEGKRGTMEFATEAYNYNTTSDDDPRNLVVLCTSQGIAVQQDGEGKKRLLHHRVDHHGRIHRFWLEAERSDHAVGGPQLESTEEREDALRRGKATSEVLGIRAMGKRFNALMTIQVPLKQFETPAQRARREARERAEREARDQFRKKVLICLCSPLLLLISPLLLLCAPCLCFWSFYQESKRASTKPRARKRLSAGDAPLKAAAAPSARGTKLEAPVANAARVSLGSEQDIWPGLSVGDVELARHPSEHVTVTVVMYNTVAGGTPSEADVAAAIDDLEALYASCSESSRLADDAFDFMKEELTTENATDIVTKLASQPPTDSAV